MKRSFQYYLAQAEYEDILEVRKTLLGEIKKIIGPEIFCLVEL